MVRFD